MNDDEGSNQLKKALRKFFSGGKSEYGSYLFDRWFNSHDDREGAFDKLDRDEVKERQDKVYVSIQKELKSTPIKKALPIYQKRIGGRRGIMFRLVAVLMLGCMLTIGLMYYNNMFSQEKETVSYIEKENPRGQISSYILPEGTRVWLNVDSKIIYPEKFNDEKREITLEGEAFFDVNSDTSRPFIVQTASLSTQVLGTSFNVKAYPEDGTEEIILVSGEVEVFEKNNNKKEKLIPDQKIQFDENLGLQKPTYSDTQLANAWTKRELVFVRENFATIAKTFERWYAVDFVFENEKIKEETFVYHFEDLSLENSMSILKELADFEFEITENTVFVSE